MKVLLLSVITENLFMTVLPLGAAYVAAAARDAGHDVKMLSLRSSEPVKTKERWRTSVHFCVSQKKVMSLE